MKIIAPIAVIVLWTVAAIGREVKPVDAGVEDAKYDFHASIIQLRVDIEKDLAQQGKKSPDATRQLTEFKRNGGWPASADPQLRERFDTAREKLITACREVIDQLRETKDETAASELEKWVAALPADNVPKPEPLARWMTPQSTWVGRLENETVNNKSSGESVHVVLTITSRDGNELAGTIQRGAGKAAVSRPVRGTVSKNNLELFEGGDAQPKYDYAGSFDGTTIHLGYSGVGKKGRSREGNVTLERKPAADPAARKHRKRQD